METKQLLTLSLFFASIVTSPANYIAHQNSTLNPDLVLLNEWVCDVPAGSTNSFGFFDGAFLENGVVNSAHFFVMDSQEFAVARWNTTNTGYDVRQIVLNDSIVLDIVLDHVGDTYL